MVFSREEWIDRVNEALDSIESRTPFEYACEQLRHAIEHFYKKENIPAITLAGAAQEVLGRIAAERVGQNAIDRSLEWHVQVYKLAGRKDLPTRRKMADSLNWIRNELKHNSKGVNHEVSRFYGKAAIEMIDAALLNVMLIEGRAPSDEILAEYHAECPTWEGIVPNLNDG